MKLAIDGGEPVKKQPFPKWPMFDQGEKEALQRALEQGQWWRMSGKEVDAFEKEFAEYHNAAGGALAVSNGTHALEVALLTLGIKPGDEVIVPAFTFISTSMAVQRVGATAIPVDVDLDSYGVTADIINAAITSKTKAIIPVHMAGQVVDMQAIEALAGSKQIAVIQDACHAQGAISQNKKVGEWNSMACFSFQNFKLMTAGEGGAITFPNSVLRDKAFLIHNCGRQKGDRNYLHDELGSNYRLNEFSAAVLREQLKRLQKHNETRERNAAILYQNLENIDGIIIPKRSAFINLHPHYMAMFRIDFNKHKKFTRDYIVDALVAEGIPAYKNYKSIYKIKAFWHEPAPTGTPESWMQKCPNTEKISTEGIWLHHSALLGTKEDVMDIITAIKKVLGLI